MNLLVVIAPAIALIGLHVVGFFSYGLLCVSGNAPHVAGLEGRRFSLGKHFMVYWHWALSPFERFLIKHRVSPNTITLIAMAVSVGSGFAIAFGHLATGGWLYILSGTLDIIDGRLARATQQSSAAGGFLDSVSDRWAETAVFIGFAWLLRETNWFLAVIVALAGSMMVSYVRAAGEVRGTLLDGGFMKRPERILIVSIGTLVCAGLASVPSTMHLAPTVLGSVLAFVGAGSVATALGRWRQGYKNLQAMDAIATAKEQALRPDSAPQSVQPAAKSRTAESRPGGSGAMSPALLRRAVPANSARVVSVAAKSGASVSTLP